MEDESSSKQKTFEQLTKDEQDVYNERATYLIDKGYFTVHYDVKKLAQQIYEASWRVQKLFSLRK